jgi:hypothetical protein
MNKRRRTAATDRMRERERREKREREREKERERRNGRGMQHVREKTSSCVPKDK